MRTLTCALLIAAVGCAAPPVGRDLAADRSAAVDRATDDPAFPHSWLGTWSGTVVAHAPDREPTAFTIERRITATDDPEVFRWVTHFSGDAGDQEREYELRVRDAGTGAYAIDELNGVLLDAHCIDDVLVTWFELGGTRLLTREALVGAATPDEHLLYEIFVTADHAGTPTGPTEDVVTFPVTAVQRGRLERMR